MHIILTSHNEIFLFVNQLMQKQMYYNPKIIGPENDRGIKTNL